jgi:hypothetical protein
MATQFAQALGAQAQQQAQKKFVLTTNFFEDFFDTTPHDIHNVPHTLGNKPMSHTTDEASDEPEFLASEDPMTGADSEEP